MSQLQHGESISQSDNTQLQSTLNYYKDKVDELCKERLWWLSKFEQCKQNLQQKHNKQQSLKKLKDKNQEARRDIAYHDIALLQEGINVIREDRQNLLRQHRDAEEILKMNELMQEYPIQPKKEVFCARVQMGGIIDNELNIHSKGNKPSKKTHKQKSQITFSPTKTIKNNKMKKLTAEQLLERQLLDLKNNQQKELVKMEEEVDTLKKKIEELKNQEAKELTEERKVVDTLNSDYKKLEEKHKKLADAYFAERRKMKNQSQDIKKSYNKLLETHQILEQKIASESKIYQRQDKAKQTLVLRKSEDFQEDYKARMRAKERNLQALRENYQKMQEICIEKIRKLEETVMGAKCKLENSESKRSYMIRELRSELNLLESKANQQRLLKASQELKAKEREYQERQKEELEKNKQHKKQRAQQKNKMIEEAYRKTMDRVNKNNKNFSQKKIALQQDLSSEESLDMSDLENIKKQIQQLENKICSND